MPSAVLFVIGASGSGKTAAVEALTHRKLAGVGLYHFDSIGVPGAAEMRCDFGGGEGWQAHATAVWMKRLESQGRDPELAVLEGQTRPSYIRSALENAMIVASQIVLLDCRAEVRAARLSGPRQQPALANARMDGWAAYLRGQADALGLPVVDTSELSVEAVADMLERAVERLRESARRKSSQRTHDA
jgi:hypothetical protein